MYHAAAAELALLSVGCLRPVHALSTHLAARGWAALTLTPFAVEDVRHALEAGRALLTLCGARRFVLAGGADAAAPLLETAPLEACEAVVLLSPTRVVSERTLQRLRGRDLFVFTGEESAAARTLKERASAPFELHEFPGARAGFEEVMGDFLSLCVPRLEEAVRRPRSA